MASNNKDFEVEGGGERGESPKDTGVLQTSSGGAQYGDGIEGLRPPQDCCDSEANTSLVDKEGMGMEEEGAMMPSVEYESDAEEAIDPLEVNLDGREEATDIIPSAASQIEEPGQAGVVEIQVAPMDVETVVATQGNSQPLLQRKRKKETSTSPGEEEAKERDSEEYVVGEPPGRKVQGGVRTRRVIRDDPDSERETEAEWTRPKENRGRNKAVPSISGRSTYLKVSESEAVSVSSEEEYVPNTRATARNKAKGTKKRRKLERKGKDQEVTESDRSKDGSKLIKGGTDKTREIASGKAVGRLEETKEGILGGNKVTKGQLSQRKGNLSEKEDTPDAGNRKESVALGPPRYNNMTAAAAGVLALEWLDEIEACRSKSTNMQGRISGHIKGNVIKIKELVKFLVGRAEATGDPLYLRMRNSELSMQIHSIKETCAKNETDLAAAKRTIQVLKEDMAKADSKKQKTGREKKEAENKIRERESGLGSEVPFRRGDPDTEGEPSVLGKDEEGCEDAVWKPPLKGTSVLIPSTSMERKAPHKGKEREETISRKIAELVKARKQLRKDRSLDKMGNNAMAMERDGNDRRSVDCRKPRVVADV